MKKTTVKVERKRRLPLQDWPQPDRKTWQAACQTGDILDLGGPAANWRQATRENFVSRYGRWLAWLRSRSELDSDQAAHTRVTEAQVRNYVAALRTEVSPASVHVYVRDLLRAMQIFAPEQDWAWLKRLETKLRKSVVHTTSKIDAHIHPAQLIRLGADLMADAEISEGTPARARAVQYRDGLLLAILSARAPRRGELAAMKASEHLPFDGEAYWLVLPAENTKANRPKSHRLPTALTPWIDRYLNQHRLVLASGIRGNGCDSALWLTENGEQLGGPAINHQVRKRTRETLGHAIPPHRFRDCLTTAMAVDLPAHLHAAATLLDHAGLSVTQTHYNQATRHQALNAYHRHLQNLRKDLADGHDD